VKLYPRYSFFSYLWHFISKKYQNRYCRWFSNGKICNKMEIEWKVNL